MNNGLPVGTLNIFVGGTQKMENDIAINYEIHFFHKSSRIENIHCFSDTPIYSSSNIEDEIDLVEKCQPIFNKHLNYNTKIYNNIVNLNSKNSILIWTGTASRIVSSIGVFMNDYFKIFNWCKNNCCDNFNIQLDHVSFESESDCSLFKLLEK